MQHYKYHPCAPKRHVNLRMERWHRHRVYVVCALLVATGILWLAAHYWMRTPGEFGETVHPLERGR